MKQLDTTQKITIITCGELGLLDEIKTKYNILELGNINDSELSYAYNACDIFVMPSIGESFGMMAVEAMSCGKPVICFNNTALPSVTFAPDCGIAVENLNSTKLMEAIKYLSEDATERKRRGALARKIVKSTYNIDIYNQKMQTLYKEVLSRKHTFNVEILKHEIKPTPSVIALRKKLTLLTKKVFPKKSKYYKTALYKTPTKKFKRNSSIKYGSLEVQLLIDQYNQKLYQLSQEDIEESTLEHLSHKIAHFSKLLIFLLKNDRETLFEVIKKRLKIRRRIL